MLSVKRFGMSVIRIRYRNGSDFLAHFLATFPTGGIFFPTRKPVQVGTPVALEIRFPELPNRVLVRGEVAWRRAGRHSIGLRAGWGIAFAEEEAPRRDFLLRLARGEKGGLFVHRRFRRFLVKTPTQWRPKALLESSEGTLVDIGPGGALVSDTQAHPQPGADVVLTITPPGALVPIALEGRVAWVRGEDATSGFGVQFKVRDVGGLRRIKEVVRRLESSTLPALPQV